MNIQEGKCLKGQLLELKNILENKTEENEALKHKLETSHN